MALEREASVNVCGNKSRIRREWRRYRARSPQPAHKSSNLNPLGPPGGPVRFSKQIDTKHMCFTVESGPGPTGTRTKTLRRRLFVVKRIEFEKSKMKSTRKASVNFCPFEDVRSGMATCDPRLPQVRRRRQHFASPKVQKSQAPQKRQSVL